MGVSIVSILKRLPAEVFPPAEFIADEIGARGWSMEEFGLMAGLKQNEAEQLAGGFLRVTPRLAFAISRAFGTSPTLWYRLQRTFDAGAARKD